MLDRLSQDHEVIEQLLRSFAAAADGSSGPDQLGRHLDGIAAIMESHFGYEERQLLPALEHVALDLEIGAALGPLAGA